MCLIGVPFRRMKNSSKRSFRNFVVIAVLCPSALARASYHVSDFNCRNKALTGKLLKQGYCYYKRRKSFSIFYRRHSGLVERYNVSLMKLLQQSMPSEPEFYGDLAYRFSKKCGKIKFFGTIQKAY